MAVASWGLAAVVILLRWIWHLQQNVYRGFQVKASRFFLF